MSRFRFRVLCYISAWAMVGLFLSFAGSPVVSLPFVPVSSSIRRIEREKLGSHAFAFVPVNVYPVSGYAVVCICAVSRPCNGLYRVFRLTVFWYA